MQKNKPRVAWNKGLPAPWARNNPQTFKKGQVSPRKGIKATQETKNKLSKSHLGQGGDRAGNWKGGISYDWKVKNAPRPRPKICEVCADEGKIYFDHDHKTGKFRGWICMHCNFALGHVRDDKNKLIALINYLDKNETETKNAQGAYI